MKEMEQMINEISDDIVVTGAEAKQFMHIVREYAEIEIESKKKLNQFLQSMIKHYENKSQKAVQK